MQIIIDVPEGEYEELTQIGESTIPLGLLLNFRKYIRNGTVLPKGHGRLIDADTVKKQMIPLMSFSVQKWISEVDLDVYVPTIIEADKEV